MRRLAAIAAMVAALIASATAQHPAAHGGFSGHAASAPNGSFGSTFGGSHVGGFAPPSGSFARYGSFGAGSAGRSWGFVPQRSGPAPGYRSFYPAYRPAYRGGAGPDRAYFGPNHGWDGHYHHHVVTYGYGYIGYPYAYAPYPYPIFTGYVDPWLFGPDTYDQDSYGYAALPASGNETPAPYPNYGEPGYGPQNYVPGNENAIPYQAMAQTQQPSAHRPVYAPSGSSASPASEQAVTLIFNDGRPAEQIHNYLLTSTTITVLDQRYREIPLGQINIAATEATNRAAGVDFHVPASH